MDCMPNFNLITKVYDTTLDNGVTAVNSCQQVSSCYKKKITSKLLLWDRDLNVWKILAQLLKSMKLPQVDCWLVGGWSLLENNTKFQLVFRSLATSTLCVLTFIK